MVERIQITDRLTPFERPERIIQKNKGTQTSQAIDADSESKEKHFQDNETEKKKAGSDNKMSVDAQVEKKTYRAKTGELDIVA